jgi:hypothetical protein
MEVGALGGLKKPQKWKLEKWKFYGSALYDEKQLPCEHEQGEWASKLTMFLLHFAICSQKVLTEC